MRKAVKNSVGILLLALALVVTQIPTTEAAAETSTASDFQMNGDTLVRYVGTAQTVSVPAKVKRVGEEAFAGNTTVREVSFKGEVEEIAYRAFAGCGELRRISVPDSVTEIGSGAFGDCVSLTEAAVGKGLKKLGIGVFAGCGSLEKITVDKENTAFTVADGCLYDKEKTVLYFMIPVREKDTYTMPSTVADIAEYAFWGCDSVKALSLSANLRTIPAYAFSNCKSLQSLAIPYSVDTIELMAFADCVNLETVSVPSSVSYIHKTAFDGCPRLKIVADLGTAGYKYYEEWKQTHDNQAEYEDTGNAGQDEEEPGQGGGAEPEKGTDDNNGGGQGGQYVLGSSHVVGSGAVVFIDNSLPTVYGLSGAETSGMSAVSDGEGGTVPPDLFPEAGNVKNTVIPKFTVAFGNTVADQAFYKNDSLEQYAVPEGVTAIGEFAFARSGLGGIDIPEGVTTIGYGAFYHCGRLRDVSIPDSVTEIAPKAFEKSLWLQNWLAGGSEDYLIVGDGILLAYRGGGGDIVLPDGVRQIGPEVFKDNLAVTGVTLPDSLVKIGEGAFEGCKSLSGVGGGKYVEAIGDRAFAGCGIETFHVTENVKEIGRKALDFSELTKSVSTKVAVFDGVNLPRMTYGDTARRLSNAEARGPALNEVLFAIVDKSMREADFAGTVLDGGFEGVIAYISSKERGTVTVCGCTLDGAQLETIYLPEYIIVDGTSYRVEGAENLASYCAAKRDLGVPGEITVIQEAKAFEGMAGVEAQLEGNDGYYYLKISDSESGADLLERGFEAVYGSGIPEGAAVFSLSLKDRETGVEISKLGNSVLTVRVPVPATMPGQNVRVVTADRNGQLENVACRFDGDGALLLELSHLSPFAVYSAGRSSTGRMDASPDTGEAVHPKWFLSAGLFCLAMLVFFVRPRRKAEAGRAI